MAHPPAHERRSLGRSGLSAPDCSSSRSPRPSGPSPPPVTPGPRLPGRGSLRGVRRRPPEVAAPASRPCAATPRRAAPSASRPWVVGAGVGDRHLVGRGPSPARAARSVTIPTSLSPSTTGREPTSSEVRRRAASTTVASLEIDGGGDASSPRAPWCPTSVPPQEWAARACPPRFARKPCAVSRRERGGTLCEDVGDRAQDRGGDPPPGARVRVAAPGRSIEEDGEPRRVGEGDPEEATPGDRGRCRPPAVTHRLARCEEGPVAPARQGSARGRRLEGRATGRQIDELIRPHLA